MEKRTLIVDDDVVLADALKCFFESSMIPAVTATSVSAAQRVLDSKKISLVCTDWDLDDGTGLDVLRYASKKSIPVVFLTGHGEDSYIEKAIALGAANYYIKGQVSYRNFINELVSLL